jgi:hypothetical protein
MGLGSPIREEYPLVMINKFFTFNHQGKADAYIRAMTARGWQETKDPGEARFIFSDSNVLHRGKSLEVYGRRAKVFIYPHAARPNIFWDFPGQDFAGRIDCHFVAAPGHAQVMKAYGFPHPIEVIGWSLSRILPFQPKKELKRILFGPIHPNSNGFLCALDRSLNRRAFETLLKVSDICNAELIVRHIGDLKVNNIWKAGGVTYIEGQKDQSTNEIDRADLVVSHQTFAYLAVARGIPTLMMGEADPPRWGGTEEALKYVKSWEKYKDLLMYPLDLLSAADPIALIESATCSDEAIRDWRESMIGRPFDTTRFADTLEGYL